MAATQIIVNVKWGLKKSLCNISNKKNMLDPAVESQVECGKTKAIQTLNLRFTSLNRKIITNEESNTFIKSGEAQVYKKTLTLNQYNLL